ncbi:MAG: hypothetical protein ABIE70_13540 [bacterium]
MFKSFLITCAALLLLSGAASSQSAFDNTGRGFGIAFDLGFGITKGLDVKKELETTLDIKQSSGLVLAFGASGRMKLVQGLYAKPFFHVSFYGESVDLKGIQVQNNQGQVFTLKEITWNTTHLSFGVVPSWYFRLANSSLHPFAGLGIKLHSHSFGKPKLKYEGGEEELKADSKFGFGISPTVGAEYNFSSSSALSFSLAFDLIFSSNVSNVFSITTGYVQYF